MAKQRGIHARRVKNRNSFRGSEDYAPSYSSTLTLKRIEPLTEAQEEVFEAWEDGQNIVLHGFAGTGKSYVALWLALKAVLDQKTEFEKVIIVRSAVPARDVGFLPGSLKDKIRVLEEPYIQICSELFDDENAYDILKAKKLVEFTSTSYQRGLTYSNCIIIFDEIQNASTKEIGTAMTRVGENTRLLVCGDFRQNDLKKDDPSGIYDFIEITKRMESFDFVEFMIEDCVRSGFAKEWLIASEEYYANKTMGGDSSVSSELEHYTSRVGSETDRPWQVL